MQKLTYKIIVKFSLWLRRRVIDFKSPHRSTLEAKAYGVAIVLIVILRAEVAISKTCFHPKDPYGRTESLDLTHHSHSTNHTVELLLCDLCFFLSDGKLRMNFYPFIDRINVDIDL